MSSSEALRVTSPFLKKYMHSCAYFVLAFYTYREIHKQRQVTYESARFEY
ncbi:hypothetical protein PSSHI_10500 [Photobacterium sp. R1]